jgi:hypothetical protein
MLLLALYRTTKLTTCCLLSLLQIIKLIRVQASPYFFTNYGFNPYFGIEPAGPCLLTLSV